MRRTERIVTIGLLAAGCGGRTSVGLDEIDPGPPPGDDVAVAPDDAAGDDSSGERLDAAADATLDAPPDALAVRDAGRWADAPSFCAPAGALDSVDVWSDERGVFVLTSGYLGAEDVQFDPGPGWTATYHAPTRSSLMRLTGFRGGPLVLYGEATCGIRLLDRAAARCAAGVSFAQSVFTVRPDLAYALENDRVLWYRGGDGGLWTQLGDPLPPAGQVRGEAVWSNGDASLVAATLGHVYLSSRAGPFVSQPALPPDAYLSAWGFADGDLWIGDANGSLLHGDGSTWKIVWTDSACGSGRAIQGIWGQGGRLFFRTASSVATWDGKAVRTIVDLGCSASRAVTGLWGNSPTEVFYVTKGPSTTNATCGPAEVFLYDGAAARPL